jgi:butyrate kinase
MLLLLLLLMSMKHVRHGVATIDVAASDILGYYVSITLDRVIQVIQERRLIVVDRGIGSAGGMKPEPTGTRRPTHDLRRTIGSSKRSRKAMTGMLVRRRRLIGHLPELDVRGVRADHADSQRALLPIVLGCRLLRLL